MRRAWLETWARDQCRFWRYSRDEWYPERRWAPYLGGDEYGRKTIVQRVPFVGYILWAFWLCKCDECHQSRVETWEMEEDTAAEQVDCSEPWDTSGWGA